MRRSPADRGRADGARPGFCQPLALALFTEIDPRHLRFANDGLGLFGAVGPAALRDPVLRQTLMHVRRQRHVHHFRIGEMQAALQIDIFLR
jgi:hypothetical protein